MDAIDFSIDNAYKKCMEESKLIPVIEPKVDVKTIDQNAVTFTFTIITKPEVKLGEYKDLKIKNRRISAESGRKTDLNKQNFRIIFTV